MKGKASRKALISHKRLLPMPSARQCPPSGWCSCPAEQRACVVEARADDIIIAASNMILFGTHTHILSRAISSCHDECGQTSTSSSAQNHTSATPVKSYTLLSSPLKLALVLNVSPTRTLSPFITLHRQQQRRQRLTDSRCHSGASCKTARCQVSNRSLLLRLLLLLLFCSILIAQHEIGCADILQAPAWICSDTASSRLTSCAEPCKVSLLDSRADTLEPEVQSCGRPQKWPARRQCAHASPASHVLDRRHSAAPSRSLRQLPFNESLLSISCTI